MSDLRERNFLCDELFDWAFGDDENDLKEALLQSVWGENHASYRYSSSNSGSIYNVTSATHIQPNPLPL